MLLTSSILQTNNKQIKVVMGTHCFSVKRYAKYRLKKISPKESRKKIRYQSHTYFRRKSIFISETRKFPTFSRKSAHRSFPYYLFCSYFRYKLVIFVRKTSITDKHCIKRKAKWDTNEPYNDDSFQRF